MTPINTLTVGIPSFVLALRANYHKPEGKFITNILENSIPAAISVVFNILVIQVIGIVFKLPNAEISTMNVLLTGIAGLILLTRIARPIDLKIRCMIICLFVLFMSVFLVVGNLFAIETILNRNVFFYMPLIYISIRMFSFLRDNIHQAGTVYTKWKNERRESKKYKIL
jgi:cation-transporting ATPase E